MVGDRGMITAARIEQVLRPAGLDWITALRGPAIQQLAAEDGPLQLSLFDTRDMASITSPDFPGERLIVCRNPDLAAERARKREDLLAATEKDLARIKTAIERTRNPLRGSTEIALKVGEVLNAHKMKKHFDLEITDAAFSFTRKTDAITAEAATDGIYIVRTSLAEDTLGDADSVRSYKSLSLVERGFRCIKTVDLHVRPVYHWWRIGSERMCFSACWPIISNGTCARSWHRCCSMTRTKRGLRRDATAWWRRRSVRRPR
jgi:transposase